MPAAWMIQSKSGIGRGSGSIRSWRSTMQMRRAVERGQPRGVPRMKLSHTVTRIGCRADGAVEVQRRLDEVVAEETRAAGDQQALAQPCGRTPPSGCRRCSRGLSAGSPRAGW